ncbi:membrane cofactor protein-like isoform 9-T9 [Pholidichthys leucotaenia]
MNVAACLLLSSIGLAITAQAQNCSAPEAGPNMSLKDEFILLTEFKDGSKVSFSCNVGYGPVSGSPSITCTAGVWSPVTLSCAKKSCGSAGQVDNGEITYEGVLFGDKAVLSCNAGYMLVGQNTRTCGDQGWLGRFGVCEVIKCLPPPNVAGASYTPVNQNYNYNEIVRYTCRSGLTLNGSNQLHCSDSGAFAPEPPSCIVVECKEPIIANGEWSGGARPPYGHTAHVTLICKSGYVMKGERHQTCGIDSEWAPGLPECLPSGSDFLKPLLITLAVVLVVAALIACGCYRYGIPAFLKKKGTWRGNTDKEATRNGEDVALS